jgi:hypothetical protein
MSTNAFHAYATGASVNDCLYYCKKNTPTISPTLLFPKLTMSLQQNVWHAQLYVLVLRPRNVTRLNNNRRAMRTPHGRGWRAGLYSRFFLLSIVQDVTLE